MEQTASTINMPKIKDFLKKYNFYIVCFFCLVLSVCSIWVKPYFLIFYLVLVGVSCLFYDINKVLVLNSFILYFLRCFDWWYGAIVLICSLLILCVRKYALEKEKFDKRLIFPLVVLAYFIVIFFCINFDGERWYSFFNITGFILLSIEIFILRKDIDFKKVLRELSFWLVLSSVIAFVFYHLGLYVESYHIDDIGIYRFMSFMGHENTLSIWAIAFLCMFFVLFGNKKISVVEFVCWLGALAVIGIMTKSKMFLLLLIVVVLLYLILAFIRNWKIGVVQLFFIGIVVGMCFIVIPNKTLEYIGRFTNYFDGTNFWNMLTTGRVEIWKKYINLWLSNPVSIIFGNGETYSFAAKHGPHSVYVGLLATHGILGLSLFIALFAYYMFFILKSKNCKISSFFALVVVLIIAFFEQLYADRALIFILSFTIVYAMTKKRKECVYENVVISENKKISVIMPVYNVEKYLKKCIESVLSQTYKNFEIILVDDGSPDNCGKICDECAQKDERIKVIHKENGGVSSARNAGLKIATGDYIIFIDSDDYINENMFAHMIKNAKGNNSDIVVCNFNIEKDGYIKKCSEKIIKQFCETKDLTYIFNRSRFSEFDDEFSISHTFSCFLWRMMFSKKLISEIEFNEKLKVMEDVEFFVRVLKKDENIKISHLDEYLYFYQIRQNSAMRVKKEILDNHLELLLCLKNVLDKDSDKELLKHFAYAIYVDCIVRNKAYGAQDDLSKIQDFGCKENYKISNTYTHGFILKMRNFLVYHKMYFTIKVLYKLLKKA